MAINDLAKNFICFKFDQETADRFETAVQAACVTQRKRKRRDLVVEIDSSSDRKEGRKEMFYLTTHSTHFILRLCGVRHMVKDH